MTYAAHIAIGLTLLPLVAAALASLGAEPASGYAWWWGTPRGWSILLRTFVFAGGAAVFGTVTGCFIAAAAARANRPLAALFIAIACVPLLLPSSLLGTAWIMAAGRAGWLTQATGWPWTVYHTPIAAAVIGLRYCGVAALMTMAQCRRQAEPDAAQLAFDLPLRRRLLHLRLRPLTRPLLAAWLLLVVLCANDHILPGMFLVTTYGTQALIEQNALLNQAGAAALAIPPMLLMLGFSAVAIRLAWRRFPATDRLALASSRSAVGPALRVLPILCIAVGLPLVALAVRAGSWVAVREAWAACAPERWRTWMLAMVGGPLCAIVAAAPVAHWLTRRRHGETSTAPVLLVLLVAPASLLATGVIVLADRAPLRPFRDTDLPLMLGYLCRFTPIAGLLLAAAWSRVPSSALDAARAHGLGAWRTLRALVVPLHGPGFLAAAALSAMLIATDLELSLMLAPPGVTTLGVRLYSMIHTAPDALVSAAALATAGAVVVPFAIVAAGAALWSRDRHA